MLKGGLPALMRQAQQMQTKIAKVQKDMESHTFEATAGGGIVTVVANGANEIVSVTIDKEKADLNDLDMLQALIAAACTNAIKIAKEKVKAEVNKVTGGVNLPGM
jgi:DNA-binding YbaB/EbfC family protein